MDRTFIIGNGGSGKSWLGRRLAERHGVPLVHLDDLHWLPNFAGERPRDERDRLVADASEGEAWVMEGIYGSILQQVLARVTRLIWLDLPDDACIANLMDRGQQGGGTAEQFEDLLSYTRGYRIRENSLNSFEGHQRFFEAFGGKKARLKSRAKITVLLDAA